jgi:hypothetical protein
VTDLINRKENEMNTMNMPGFSAECALYSNHKNYWTAVHTSMNQLTTSPQVTPQLQIACFIIAAGATYGRCVGLGYDSGACFDLAVDLGLLVCG